MTRHSKRNIGIIIIIIVLTIIAVRRHHDAPVSPLTATSTDVVINDTNDFYTLDVTYPVEPRDTSNVMATNIMDIVNKKKEEWKIGGALYEEEQQLTKQFPDRPAMKYELDIQYKKYVSATRDTVSYVFQNYEYTGGAHGNGGVVTYTFDKNGLMDIQNVLNLGTNNNDIALTRVLREKLKTVLTTMAGPDAAIDTNMLDDGLGLSFLSIDGKFDVAKCQCDGFFFGSNFQKFVILDEGIKFIFDPYQVAPYVYGSPEVTLTWDELKPFLK